MLACHLSSDKSTVLNENDMPCEALPVSFQFPKVNHPSVSIPSSEMLQTQQLEEFKSTSSNMQDFKVLPNGHILLHTAERDRNGKFIRQKCLKCHANTYYYCVSCPENRNGKKPNVCNPDKRSKMGAAKNVCSALLHFLPNWD